MSNIQKQHKISPAIAWLTIQKFIIFYCPLDGAHTTLRFLIQSGVVVIPKSVHKERMEENFNVFDFTLSEEDMKTLETLDGGESLFFSHHDPATVEWFMSIV